MMQGGGSPAHGVLEDPQLQEEEDLQTGPAAGNHQDAWPLNQGDRADPLPRQRAGQAAVHRDDTLERPGRSTGEQDRSNHHRFWLHCVYHSLLSSLRMILPLRCPAGSSSSLLFQGMVKHFLLSKGIKSTRL